MRQRLAFFNLLASQTLKPLVAICVLLAGAQTFAMSRVLLLTEEEYPLSDAIVAGHLPWCFTIALILTMLLLMAQLQSGKAKPGYTADRLGIPQWQRLLLVALHAGLCLLFVWAVETLLMLGLSQWYLSHLAEQYQSHQALVIETYGSDLLHCLLPLSDTVRWVRNITLLVTTSLACGRYTVVRWRGGNFRLTPILVGASPILFIVGGLSGSGDWFIITAGFAISAIILITARDEVYYEN